MTRPTERAAAIRSCLDKGLAKDVVARAFSLDMGQLEEIAGRIGATEASATKGAVEHPGLLSGHRRVLEALSHSQSIEVIARDAGLSISSVRTYLADLRRLGLVAPVVAQRRQADAELATVIPLSEPAATPEEANQPVAERLFRQRIGAARFSDDPRQALLSRRAEPKLMRGSGSALRTLGGVIGELS